MADEEKNTQEETTSETPAEENTEEATSEEAPQADSTEGSDEPKEESEASAETPASDEGGDEVDLSEATPEQKKLIEQVENMSVLELNQLVKLLEKRFGVSAVAVAAAGGGGDAAGGEEEKDSFDVELTGAGDQKIQVIKVVKEALGLGLKEAKDMVDGAPVVIKQGMKKAEAEELKGKVEEAGGSVTLK